MNHGKVYAGCGKLDHLNQAGAWLNALLARNPSDSGELASLLIRNADQPRGFSRINLSAHHQARRMCVAPLASLDEGPAGTEGACQPSGPTRAPSR